MDKIWNVVSDLYEQVKAPVVDAAKSLFSGVTQRGLVFFLQHVIGKYLHTPLSTQQLTFHESKHLRLENLLIDCGFIHDQHLSILPFTIKHIEIGCVELDVQVFSADFKAISVRDVVILMDIHDLNYTAEQCQVSFNPRFNQDQTHDGRIYEVSVSTEIILTST
jgi:hypothetical protein